MVPCVRNMVQVGLAGILCPVIAGVCFAIWISQAGGLLGQVRNAVFQQDLPAKSEIRLTGDCRYLGGDGRYSFTFDRDGRFFQEMKSPAGESYGFDGSSYWKQDSSGAPIRISFETEAEAHAIAALLSDSWLQPVKGDALVSESGGVDLLIGQEQFAVKVKLDPATFLPKTASIDSSAGVITVSLADWRKVGGRMLPFHVDLERAGLTDTFTISASAVDDDQAAIYQMPDWKAADSQFDSSLPAELECKRAATGHMLVHPRVNGKDVGWFILDSGAEGMTIDPKVAKSLNLVKTGEVPETGVGGTIKTDVWRLDSFNLGRLSMRNVEVIGFDFAPFAPFFGVPVAGIVGYDVFRRATMEVRFSPARVALYDPDTYKTASVAWSPLRFDGGNSAVEAVAEGKPGWYRIDTGDDGWLTFQYPYVMREKMLDGRSTTASGVEGAGGTLMTRHGFISTFEIGGTTMKNVQAMFVTVNKGGFSDIFLAGNLGQGVMSPFNLVFDYVHYRIGFVPVRGGVGVGGN